MTIKTNQGWIQVSNKIVPVHPPAQRVFIEEEIKHEDLSHGGLYTEEEIDSWNSLIEYSNFHASISQQLSYGACQTSGECSPSSQFPSYNLARLIEEKTTEYNVLGEMVKKINEYGIWISVLVLTIWTVKLLIFMVTFTILTIQEGATGGLALVLSSCCGAIHRRNNIRNYRRNVMTPKPVPLIKDYEDTSFITQSPTPTYTQTGGYTVPT